MLVVDPNRRYTARQCLDHAWIRNAEEASVKKMHSSHRAFLLIRKLPIFDNIDPAYLQEVTDLLKVVRVEQGKFVYQAGDPGDCMFFINSGTVQILVNGNEVDRITTGEFFGEISMTVSSPRTHDVKSLGATGRQGLRSDRPAEAAELFQLDRRDFDAVQDKYPVIKSRLALIGESRVKRASAPDSSSEGGAAGPSETPGAATPAPKSSGGAGGAAGRGGGANSAAATPQPQAAGGVASTPSSPNPARKPEVENFLGRSGVVLAVLAALIVAGGVVRAFVRAARVGGSN